MWFWLGEKWSLGRVFLVCLRMLLIFEVLVLVKGLELFFLEVCREGEIVCESYDWWFLYLGVSIVLGYVENVWVREYVFVYML